MTLAMVYVLSDHDKAELAQVCERFGVSELLMFGSGARGDFTPASDIDLLVAFRPGERVGWFRFSELQEALSWFFAARST